MAGITGHPHISKPKVKQLERLYAGAGKEEISFPWGIFPFKEGPDIWTGIHDTPCVRVLIFEDGTRWCLVSVEMVILESKMITDIKNIICKITGISQDHIWISVTHTVTMPHLFERDHEGEGEDNLAYRLKRHIISAAADAAKTATECMKPASIGTGHGTCSVNTNRMIPTADGWWIGNGEEYPCDHDVPVIRIDDDNGDPFIIMYNYACELSIMDKSVMRDGGRHITADLAGITSGMIEKAFKSPVTAVFLPGPSSDQGPVYKTCRTLRGTEGSYQTIDIRDDGWLLLQLAGERLAEQVIITAEKINCSLKKIKSSFVCRTFTFEAQKLKGLPNPLRAPLKSWTSVPDGEHTRSVEILKIGRELAIVSAGGLSAKTAMYIKQNSPYKHTIIMEHVAGGAPVLPTDGIKGMADAEAYDLGTVHAKNSEFAKGSAEKMTGHILELLNEY